MIVFFLLESFFSRSFLLNSLQAAAFAGADEQKEESENLRESKDEEPLVLDANTLENYWDFINESGIRLQDPITLTPIGSLRELQEAYALCEKSPEQLSQDLNKLHTLLNNFNSYHLSFENAFSQLESLKINRHQFDTPFMLINYEQLWSAREQAAEFNANYLEDLYTELAEEAILTTASLDSPYSQEEDFLEYKHSCLVHFLQNIYRGPYASYDGESLLNIGVASHLDHGDSSQQSSVWFAELRYKLSVLASKLSDLSPEQKVMLATYFIHAGDNCNDGKWHAVQDAYLSFARDDFERLNQEESNGYAQNLVAKINRTAAQLRSQALSSSIWGVIQELSSQAEASTYFQATWDRYAPSFGLMQTGAGYMGFAQFIPEERIKEAYSAKKFFERSLNKHITEWRENNLGFLAQLFSDETQEKSLFITYLEMIGLITKADSEQAWHGFLGQAEDANTLHWLAFSGSYDSNSVSYESDDEYYHRYDELRAQQEQDPLRHFSRHVNGFFRLLREDAARRTQSLSELANSEHEQATSVLVERLDLI